MDIDGAPIRGVASVADEVGRDRRPLGRDGGQRQLGDLQRTSRGAGVVDRLLLPEAVPGLRARRVLVAEAEKAVQKARLLWALCPRLDARTANPRAAGLAERTLPY